MKTKKREENVKGEEMSRQTRLKKGKDNKEKRREGREKKERSGKEWKGKRTKAKQRKGKEIEVTDEREGTGRSGQQKLCNSHRRGVCKLGGAA